MEGMYTIMDNKIITMKNNIRLEKYFFPRDKLSAKETNIFLPEIIAG